MTSSAPLVTIGIPTYNRVDSYLPEALESARSQTYSHLEIVVSDNGSTDGTREYVTSLDDSRIHYIRHEPPVSPNENFNACLEHASGEYFLLLHDDDQVDRGFVEACVDALDGSNDVGVVRTGNRVVDDNGRILSCQQNHAVGLDLTDMILAWFRGRTSVYFCNTLFHTEALRSIGGFSSPNNLVQDNVALIKLAAARGRADVSSPLASFRRHARKMALAADVADWCEDSLYVLDVVCELVPERADQVRAEGMKFFAEQNYRRISRAPSLNLRHFWHVYRAFDYGYAPWTFLIFVVVREWLESLWGIEGSSAEEEVRHLQRSER